MQLGFSKDNKFNQPQIVLGLVVTKEGFPIEFRIFTGSKLEEKTLIPTLLDLQRKHQIAQLTVVADAAMISDKNVKAKSILDHPATAVKRTWRVEKAFRITRSDIQARPIYHHQTTTIIAHLLICFMALCIAKHMEMKTKESLAKIIRVLQGITDTELENTITKEIHALRKKLSTPEEILLKKLEFAY